MIAVEKEFIPGVMWFTHHAKELPSRYRLGREEAKIFLHLYYSKPKVWRAELADFLAESMPDSERASTLSEVLRFWDRAPIEWVQQGLECPWRRLERLVREVCGVRRKEYRTWHGCAPVQDGYSHILDPEDIVTGGEEQCVWGTAIWRPVEADLVGLTAEEAWQVGPARFLRKPK